MFRFEGMAKTIRFVGIYKRSMIPAILSPSTVGNPGD